jgi:hypothetical protein
VKSLEGNQAGLMSVSELFIKSFQIYKRLFWQLLGMFILGLSGLLSFVVVGIISSLVGLFIPITYDLSGAINVLLSLPAGFFSLYCLLLGFIGMAVVVVKNDEDIKLWPIFKMSHNKFLKILKTNFSSGIFLWPDYVFVFWVVLAENVYGRAAWDRSKELSRKSQQGVIKRLLLPIPILLLILTILNFFAVIAFFLIMPLYLIYYYSIYKDLVNLNNHIIKN